MGQLADIAPPRPRSCPASGISSAEQQPEEGRLARARGSDEEDEVALLDLERDVAERGDVPLVGLGDVVEADHRPLPLVAADAGPWFATRVPACPHIGRPATSWPAPSATPRYKSSYLRVGSCRQADSQVESPIREPPCRHRRHAAMNVECRRRARASTFPVSSPVRRSFTSWYGREHVGADLVPPGDVGLWTRQRRHLGQPFRALRARRAWRRGSASPSPCSGAGCARFARRRRCRSAGG